MSTYIQDQKQQSTTVTIEQIDRLIELAKADLERGQEAIRRLDEINNQKMGKEKS